MPYERCMRNVAVTIYRSCRTRRGFSVRPNAVRNAGRRTPDAARRTPHRCIPVLCITMLFTTAVAAQDAPRAGLRLETSTTAARTAVDSFLTAVDAERFQDAARWLEAQDPRSAVREAWRRSGCKQPIPNELLRAHRKTSASAEWVASYRLV